MSGRLRTPKELLGLFRNCTGGRTTHRLPAIDPDPHRLVGFERSRIRRFAFMPEEV